MSKYEHSGDLFEDLKEWLGCQFISDINSEEFQCEACWALISPIFTGYTLEQSQDMMEYLSLNQYTQITKAVCKEEGGYYGQTKNYCRPFGPQARLLLYGFKPAEP